VRSDYENSAPNVVEANGEYLFFSKEVEATDGFVNLDAFLFLASLDIPESDRLIVATTYKPFACNTVLFRANNQLRV
jgi:hypothetical protein